MIIPQPNTNLIINADSLTALKEMPDNSIDSVVTDPPYGLSFMGKKWDYDVPSIELWKEVFRVMKPGAFLLSFAGTRTYHRMAVNIEDSGFEIRDMISWLYGSGFPKSLNIGKQVDKIQGNEREVTGTSKNEKDFRDVGKKVKEIIGIDKLSFGTIENAERKDLELTKGNSEWEGWGTALKPALEPIVVARKPLSKKNVALNVLKWGTGGINIGACRIGNEKRFNQPAKSIYSENKEKIINDYKGQKVQGRFPANIILDEEAGRILDEQSGVSISKSYPPRQCKPSEGVTYMPDKPTGQEHNDKGGASRFFYCAKAGKKERNLGCEELGESNIDYGERMGQNNSPIRPDGTERKANIQKNNHPTVKPIKLMQYLVRLVTPKGAVCLDPFFGSGTTGIACIKEGMNYIGIEREEDYIKIANARIKAVEDAKE